MSPRFSLRFESGERAGEVVPLSGAAFTVGRKPGNSLQLVDASVSGKHAEFTITDAGVRLRDLGSTNGTKVGGERITEAELAAGCAVHLGQVAFTFLDGEVAAAAPAAATPAAEEPAQGVISAENLARSRRKGSKLGLVALVVIAAGGGGAYYYLEQGGGGEQTRTRPVPTVQGNLLSAGFSFEEPGGWSAVQELPVSFGGSSRARYSGKEGLSASVVEGEAAEHRSDPTSARPGATFELAAQVRVRDGAAARVGIAFLPEPEEDSVPAETVIWSPVLTDTSGWTEVSLTATAPGGYDRAVAAVRADATSADGGRVEIDDVSLVSAGSQSALRVGAADFYMDGGNLTLFEVDAVLLTGFQVLGADGAPAPAELTEAAGGVRFTPAAGGTLSLRVEAPALEGGVATLGADGYQARDGDFEAAGVTDLLFGSAHELKRLDLGAPTLVSATRQGGAIEVRATLAAGAAPRVQLRFEEERRRMIDLTARAEAAESGGDRGEALRRWQELLDEVPFDAPAVARAQAERARLLQAGFEETGALSAEIERARFFRLVDLYRQCREQAVDIGARYAGSEVEENSSELVAAIDLDLSELEADLDRFEVQRLQAILAGLKAQEATSLAAEVERYLTEKYEGVK